jgi:hypothetical protein
MFPVITLTLRHQVRKEPTMKDKYTTDECMDMMTASAFSLGPVSRELKRMVLESCQGEDCDDGCPEHFACTDPIEAPTPWWQRLFRAKGDDVIQS